MFVNCNLSLKLKEKGFNEPCFGIYQNRYENKVTFVLASNQNHFYNQLCLAPTYEEACDWFDKVHKIRIDLTHADATGGYKFTIWRGHCDNTIGKWERIGYISSYLDKVERNEKAIEAALDLI